MHPVAQLSAENHLIERLAGALRYYGCGPDSDDGTGEREYDERIEYAHGHSGEGWYLGCSSYPDGGAEFIAPHEYGALLVAQAIVAEERADLAADIELADEVLGRAPPVVTFEAQLMSAGDAAFVAENCAALGHQPVLLFVAEVEEVRKAAALFRSRVRLTTGGAL